MAANPVRVSARGALLGGQAWTAANSAASCAPPSASTLPPALAVLLSLIRPRTRPWRSGAHVVMQAAFGVGGRRLPPQPECAARVAPETLTWRRMAASGLVIAHSRGVGGSVAE